MKIYLDTSLPPTRNQIVSDTNPAIATPNPIFYGDKLPLEIYPTDGVGNPTSWAGISTLHIGIGDLDNGLMYVQTQSTNFDGTSYNTTLDLNTQAIELLTQSRESIDVVFEIQAEHNNGTTETIFQNQYELRNQFLFKQNVVLVLPATPSDINAQVVVLALPSLPSDVVANTTPLAPNWIGGRILTAPLAPDQVVAVWNKPLHPSEVVAITTPLAPSELLVELLAIPLAPSDLDSYLATPARPSNLRGELANQSVPLPPSDVLAEYESAPLAPSELNVVQFIEPNAPHWIVAQKGTSGVSDLVAILLTPQAPSSVSADDLFAVLPLQPSWQDIDTIPLEPSEVTRDSSPIPPSEVATDISPVEPSEILAYDYANRPAGMFGGQPSNLRTEILFPPALPSDVNAVDYDARLPNYPYTNNAISEITTELLTPSAPSQVRTNGDQNMDTQHTLEMGTMRADSPNPDGSIEKPRRGTYYKICIDRSGSMDAIVPQVYQGSERLRAYTAKLLYGNDVGTSRQFITPITNFRNEDWVMQTTYYNKGCNTITMVFINESSRIYHISADPTPTSKLLDHKSFASGYLQQQINANNNRNAYIVGYGGGGSWGSVFNAFKTQLNDTIYGTGGLVNQQVRGLWNYNYQADNDETVQFMVDYLNLPQYPNNLQTEVSAWDDGLYGDKWMWNIHDIINGLTGYYDLNNPNNGYFTATQEKWLVEVATDANGTQIIKSQDYQVRPQAFTHVRDASLANVNELWLRVTAVGLTGSNKITPWVKCTRRAQEPLEVTTQLLTPQAPTEVEAQ